MVEGSEGPLPLLDCQNSLKKRRPPRERQCGIMFVAIFSTKGGRPRPPTVGERGPISFHTWWFFDMFSNVGQSLGVASITKLFKWQRATRFSTVWRQWNTFVEFQHLEIVEVDRCWKTVLWIDCFRWPEGPAETINYARRNKKAIRAFNIVQMMLGWDN